MAALGGITQHDKEHREPVWQCGGQGFESPQLHQIDPEKYWAAMGFLPRAARGVSPLCPSLLARQTVKSASETGDCWSHPRQPCGVHAFKMQRLGDGSDGVAGSAILRPFRAHAARSRSVRALVRFGRSGLGRAACPAFFAAAAAAAVAALRRRLWRGQVRGRGVHSSARRENACPRRGNSGAAVAAPCGCWSGGLRRLHHRAGSGFACVAVGVSGVGCGAGRPRAVSSSPVRGV